MRVALPVFLLYALTAQRDVGYWDIGEMDTVPYILGIAHSPGYPLYTLAGWVWSHALFFGSVAFRMSLLSALAMALAAWLVARIIQEETADAVSAACAAFLFAAGADVWEHATRAEPHALATLGFAATLLFLLRWHRTLRTSDLYAAAIAFGCSVAVHPIALFMLPGIALLLIGRLHEAQWRPIAHAAWIAASSAAIWFIYLPLRSAYVTSEHLDPVSALGFTGNAFWDNQHPVDAAGFMNLITGGNVDIGSGLFGYASPHFVYGVLDAIRLAFTSSAIVGAAFALVGVVASAHGGALKTSGIVACALGSVVFACGFTDESDLARYFLPGLVILSVFAGIGMTAVRAAWNPRVATGAAVAAIVALLFVNRPLFARPLDGQASRDVDVVLAATPDNAILIANWTLAPALAYASYVERRVGRRTVVPAWEREVAESIPQWSQRRPVYVVERRPDHVALRYVTR